jgi:hypothetical protein
MKKLFLISFLAILPFQGLTETLTTREYYATLQNGGSGNLFIILWTLGIIFVLVGIPVINQLFKDNREIKRRRKMDEDRKKF